MSYRNPYLEDYPSLPTAPVPQKEPVLGEYGLLNQQIQQADTEKELQRIAALPPRPEKLQQGLARENEWRAQSGGLMPQLTHEDLLGIPQAEEGQNATYEQQYLTPLVRQEQAYQNYANTPEYSRSTGAMGAAAKMIYGGGLGVGQAGAFLGEKMGMDTQGYQEELQKSIERNQRQMTPESQYAVGKEWLPEDGGESAFFDPRSYMNVVASSLPGTVAGVGLGGIAAKGLTMAAKAAMGTAAKGAQKAAGALGFGLGEGVVGGGMSGAEIAGNIAKMTTEDFKDSDVYKELTEQQGMTHEQARAQIRDAASTQAMWTAGALTTLLSAPASAYLNRLLLNRGTQDVLGKGVVDTLTGPAKSRLGEIGKGAAFEAAQEAGQSYAEVVASNLAKQNYIDPNQALHEGALENIIGGVIGGGAMGGGIGGLGYQARPLSTEEQTASDLKQIKNVSDAGIPVLAQQLEQAAQGYADEANKAVAVNDTAAAERYIALRDTAAAKLAVVTQEATLRQFKADRKAGKRVPSTNEPGGFGKPPIKLTNTADALLDIPGIDYQASLPPVDGQPQGQASLLAMPDLDYEEAMHPQAPPREAHAALSMLGVDYEKGMRVAPLATQAAADALAMPGIDLPVTRPPNQGGPVGGPIQDQGGPVGGPMQDQGGPVGGQAGSVQGGPSPRTRPEPGEPTNASTIHGNQKGLLEPERQGEGLQDQSGQNLPIDQEKGRTGIEPSGGEGATSTAAGPEAIAQNEQQASASGGGLPLGQAPGSTPAEVPQEPGKIISQPPVPGVGGPVNEPGAGAETGEVVATNAEGIPEVAGNEQAKGPGQKLPGQPPVDGGEEPVV